jgi:hypothetical protein
MRVEAEAVEILSLIFKEIEEDEWLYDLAQVTRTDQSRDRAVHMAATSVSDLADGIG